MSRNSFGLYFFIWRIFLPDKPYTDGYIIARVYVCVGGLGRGVYIFKEDVLCNHTS